MRALRELHGAGPGLRAVLIRFTVTDALETLPLALLGRLPFRPTRLPVPAERHYPVQSVLLPAYGLAVWLLMGSAGHLTLRLAGRTSRLDAVLNVVGLGMLVPMPPLWAADVALVAADRFRLPELGVTHLVAELWEVALFAVGLREVLDVPARPALVLGLGLGGVYVAAVSPVLR
jgi:hypothetical protein